MISLDNVTIAISGRSLIENASINILPNSKVGLVGSNGAGKSTLFSAIVGDLSLQKGEIFVAKGQKIALVKQEVSSEQKTLLELILESDEELHQLTNELSSTKDGARIAEITERLHHIDGYSAHSRASRILTGLGFSEKEQNSLITTFSGGKRMRVALACTIFSRPDILLLDEPSNYLDLEGTIWLKEYINNFKGTCIIISHDRELLNNCAQYILHLENKKLSLWKGNYEGFLRLRSEKQKLQQKLSKKQQDKIQKLQSFIERFRAKATKAKQAQSRIKMLQKMQLVPIDMVENVLPFYLPKNEKYLASPIIKLENIQLGYDDKIILKNISLAIDSDDRIALIGANGNGKSTFAKFLASKLKPLAGEQIKVKDLKIAYFDQYSIAALKPNQSALEHITLLFPDLSENKKRAILANIGLGEEKCFNAVKFLSGGEKSRLALALATALGAHILILDEPTNHLDIDSRQELINALNDFVGCIIIISHDKYLIESCCDKLLLVANNTIAEYSDSIDEYEIEIKNRGKKSEEKSSPKIGNDKAALRKKAAQKRESLSALKKEIKQLESANAVLYEELAQLLEKFADSETYTKDPELITRMLKRRSFLEKSIEETEALWLAKSEIYDQENS